LEREAIFGPWWYEYQFNTAVTQFGGWLENKLTELDDDGRRRYTAHDLIYGGEQKSTSAPLHQTVEEYLAGAQPAENIFGVLGSRTH
jgi:hypothetical protein